MGKQLKMAALAAIMVAALASCQPEPSPAAQEGPALAGAKSQPQSAPIAPKNLTAKPAVVDRVGTEADLELSPEEIETARKRLGPAFIGLVPCTLASEYHSLAANSAQDRLEGLGLAVRLVDPETRAEKQISALENLVATGAKGVVICVLDPKVIAGALETASAQGVLIVQYAGKESAKNGVSVSIDDADLGQAAGDYAAQLINQELGGAASVAILDYPDLPNAVLRADAIEASIKRLAPQAAIVGRFLGGTQEKGLASTESALQAHPEINVVVSINDAGAYGAFQAFTAAGRDPQKTIIVAIDAEKRALELIKEGGSYRGTVDTQPARTGALAAQGMVKLLAGSAVPREIKVPVKVIGREQLAP